VWRPLNMQYTTIINFIIKSNKKLISKEC